ncbi:MAG: hypothetical protein RKR03_18185 [Candidatus Competibacter sp.]|nr:hypothetical protein [Candidatus Competibacter sp.]
MLADVEKKPLAAEDMVFDPTSVSVRLLEGQPNLYWIRYGHRRSSEAGGDDIDHQRDWVVQKGDMGRTLFDKWTEVYENNRSGNFLSATEGVAIDYQGSTLRATSTRFRGETVEEDILEPGEPGYRESSSTESLTKVTWEIDAGTGRVVLEKTISAQFNGNALFLDDGISGWLLITRPDFRLVAWQPGEMVPRHLLPDPEKLEAIPSVAACWLYDRTPWDPAHATRNRPPASPDWVRPDHFVPDRCCAIQASADGKRILLHETVEDQRESEKPGRWLALYDVPSKTCYSANLAKDGRWGRAPFDRVGNPVFSPDGGKLGYRAKQGDRWFVVVNDRRTPDFDLVSAPVFSPDGQHVAYWARQDKKEFIVWDDQKGPAFDGAGFPVFGPDGGKVAYRAREGNQWFVIRGDKKGPAFDDIGYYTVPDTGRGREIADVVFSPDGRQLAYAARRGEQWFTVRDDQPGPTFEHVGLPAFGPDGRLAHRARRNDREFILLAGKKGPEFDFVSNPVFGADGRQMAYWARQGKTEFIVHGERKGPAFDKVGAPLFNRDGSQVIYWAKQGEKEFIMTDGKKGPEFDSIEAPAFHPRTHQIAYRVRRGNMEFVMLGDREGPEFNFNDSPRSRPLVFSPDGRKLAYAARQDGKEFILVGENKGPAFDEVGDPVFSPDGGRLAYRVKVGERWLMLATDLEGRDHEIPVGIQTNSSPTVPLNKVVPTFIPHPVTTGVILGGSAQGRWVKIDDEKLPKANPSACSSETGQCCRTLDPERIPQGLIYRLYSFDEPLGECSGGKVRACDNMATGDTDLTVDFSACSVKKFSLAIAGPWNALPRRPKVLENHRDFAPVVRKFLDRKGLKRAPVRIEYVHGVDLDGDGTEERVIHARSRKEVGDHGDPNDYSLLLLVRTVQGQQETTAISAWWPGEQENQGPYETYSSYYADANGDGVMEILVDWGYYEGSGIRVYALRDGKPVETELGYFNGL